MENHDDLFFVPLLILSFISLILISLAYLFGINLFNSINGTSLKSNDLLVIAGLTITFYSFFDQLFIGKARDTDSVGKSAVFLKLMILINIMAVSGSIILILMSSISNDYFRNWGFNILLASWIVNLGIVFTWTISPIIPNLNERGRFRDIIKVVMLVAVIIMLIYVICSIHI